MTDHKELIELLCKRNDALCREAANAIEQLNERLEISPDHPYDGIACRDETIRMLEQARADLRESLARAQEEMEGLRRDAERYRWLLDESWKHDSWSVKYCVIAKRGDGLDAAIDAAIAGVSHDRAD